MVTKQLINNQPKPWGGRDLRKRCLGQNKQLYFMDSPPSALPCTQGWLEHESSKVGDTWCNCAEMVEDGASWCNSNVHNIHRQNQVARVFLFKMPPLERKKECIKNSTIPPFYRPSSWALRWYWWSVVQVSCFRGMSITIVYKCHTTVLVVLLRTKHA